MTSRMNEFSLDFAYDSFEVSYTSAHLSINDQTRGYHHRQDKSRSPSPSMSPHAAAWAMIPLSGSASPQALPDSTKDMFAELVCT